MHKFLFTFIFFSLLPSKTSAQVLRKNVKGKVTADVNTKDLDGIYVVNLSTEDATTTKDGGYFKLPIQFGDTLMLSSIQLKGVRYAVKEEDVDKDLLFIKMDPILHQLKEVIVYNYKNINAEALGIIPRGTKSYTPAERKLKTATGLSPAAGGIVSVDPLLNFFSGRTAMLKKEVIVERKEQLLQKIDNMFEKEYFTDRLKIPAEYVKGFQYYLVENDRFAKTINAKNKTLATFIMSELAVRYLEIIECEK